MNIEKYNPNQTIVKDFVADDVACIFSSYLWKGWVGELDVDSDAYEAYNEFNKEENLCREDKWIGYILSGGRFTIVSEDGEKGDITVEKLQKELVNHHRHNFLYQYDDIDYDAIIQKVAFGKVIYG